ncbi:hypothetical protein ALQ04_02396 [Pseudomonas cichorii]|uniref:GtrC n=1 Tax=Pseudomonas cichorii TaxID=36746 RepID=A0A3M4M9C9_PSECI|nr:glucosyltransferase domain-containing protein [Pseudomonas cichorii]RMQ50119.1 hypothetical protein ALQ04_02396 [Pseudomonas cichorii]
MANLWSKALSDRQLLTFMLVASFLYILPLLLADFRYIDDNWISQYAEGRWHEQGRPLIDVLYSVGTLSRGAPDIFPLPLLFATVLMSCAMAKLARHYFIKPSALHALVPLPLLYNPFFLQNLSYQYDGPAMVLSMVAVVRAITYEKISATKAKVLVPALLIAVALALYQMSLNVFLGLACIELVRQLKQKVALCETAKFLMTQALQLGTGLILYLGIAYLFMTSGRNKLLALDSHWLPEITERLFFFGEKTGFLFTPENLLFGIPLLALAALGYFQIVYSSWATSTNVLQKGGLLLLGLALPFALLLVIPGLSLLLQDFNSQARVLMGFSSVLVAIFYLASSVNLERPCPLNLILIFPVIAMTSLAYAYGRVLDLQKELSTQVLYSLAYDLDSQPLLKPVTRFYFNGSQFENWLPAAEGTFRLMPVIKYILNVNYLVMPQMLPRAGITQVGLFGTEDPALNPAVGAPVVDRRFYRIHIRDNEAYIFMKKIGEPERYPWPR